MTPVAIIWLCAAVTAASGATITVLVRRRNREGRNGTRVVVGQLTAHVCLEGLILRRLGSCKLSRKELLALLRNLGVLCLDALSCESVQDSPGVLILVVYDVPGRVLHGVPGLAGLGSQIVVDALDSRPGLAAAILLLHLHRKELLHESGLLICAADLGGHESVTHGLLDAVDELLLFFDDDIPEDVAAKRIAEGFRAIATSIRGTRLKSRPAASYKGWMLAGLPTPKTTDDDNFDNVEDTMRKIINGSRYSTDTAKKIAHWESDQDYTSFTHCEETLYRTKAGKWFIHGTGNAATVYAVRRGDGWTAPGEQIVPLSEEVARIWVLEHLGEEQCDAIFGTGSEDTKDVQATVYIPGPLAEKMAARIDAEQCNRNELILQALREYLK